MKNNNTIIAEIHEQVAPYIKSLEEGKSARDVAKDIYVQNLEGKTDDIGYIMADGMKEIIDRYHADYKKCFDSDEALDEFVRSSLKNSLDGDYTPAERCKKLYDITAMLGAKAIMAAGGEDAKAEAEQYLEDAKGRMPEDVTPEAEANLFELCVKAIKDSNYVTAQLPDVLAAMEQVKDAYGVDDDSALDIEFGEAAADRKLITSMLAYVNVLNRGGEAEPSMESIVYETCGAMDTLATAGMVENGEIEESRAMRIIKTIGAIISTTVVSGAALIGAFFAGLGFAYIHSLIIPITTLNIVLYLGLTIGYAVFHAIKPNLDKVKDYGRKAAETAVKVAGFTFRLLMAGVKKLIEWAKPYAIAAVEWIRYAFSTVRTAVVSGAKAVIGTVKKVYADIMHTDEVKADDESESDDEEEEETEDEEEYESGNMEPVMA